MQFECDTAALVSTKNLAGTADDYAASPISKRQSHRSQYHRITARGVRSEVNSILHHHYLYQVGITALVAATASVAVSDVASESLWALQ
jgi:hypothetical protein